VNIQNHTELSKFIASANNPQIGSFGEAIFRESCRKRDMAVERVHVGQCDFVVGVQKVDVKTSRRKLKWELLSPVRFGGHRVNGVAYAVVEFYKYGALISLERESWGTQCWTELEAIYKQWITPIYGKKHSSRNGHTEQTAREH